MKSFVSLFVKHLGVVIRELLDQRGLSQKELCARIRMSEPSLSNIMTGRAKPRQVNLLRIMQELCVTPEEEQQIVAAYDHAEFRGLPERPATPERPVPEDELERVRRYMEMKSLSMAFEEEVESILQEAEVPFDRSFRRDSFICDFYVAGPPRIAVDCKFNVNRDWDRAVATVALLRKNLPCDHVLIVVPGEKENGVLVAAEMAERGGLTVNLSGLTQAIQSLLKGGIA